MPSKAKIALATLLVFGSASAALAESNNGAPRKIGPTRRTPQNCLQMIPLRSRSDSLTFTPRLSAIGSETNFSRSPTGPIIVAQLSGAGQHRLCSNSATRTRVMP